MICRWLVGAILAAVLGLILLAFANGSAGGEGSAGLSEFSLGILALGTILLAVLVLAWLVDWLDRRFLGRRAVPDLIQTVDAANLGDSSDGVPRHGGASARQLIRRWLPFVLVVLFVKLVYVFLVSVGRFGDWPATTRFYDLQAQAFLDGQLALPIQPASELSSIRNPYNPSARGSIPVLYDASYFRDRYYMYWGPAPALLVALWKLASGTSVGDEHVVFVAASGLLLFSALSVRRIRKTWFRQTPQWLESAGLLIVGTAHPLLWILNWPSIYPAAIACGQAFLIAGLYFSLPILEGRRTGTGRWFLLGSLWSMAIGCRLVIAVPVGVLVPGLILAANNTRRSGRGLDWRALSALLVPISIGLGLLGWYNQARFGNAFETGLQYQLSRLDTRSIVDSGSLFNARYFAPNSAYYGLAPLRVRSTFPFVRPYFGEIGTITARLQGAGFPRAHHVENITGLHFAMPTVGLAGYLVWELICGSRFSSRAGDQDSPADDQRRASRLVGAVSLMIVGSAAAMLPALFYFWVTNRFLLDAYPLLALASATGAFQLYGSGERRPIGRAYRTDLLMLLTSAAFGISFLLAMTGAATRIDDLNPELWRFLTDLFR